MGPEGVNDEGVIAVGVLTYAAARGARREARRTRRAVEAMQPGPDLATEAQGHFVVVAAAVLAVMLWPLALVLASPKRSSFLILGLTALVTTPAWVWGGTKIGIWVYASCAIVAVISLTIRAVRHRADSTSR